MSNEIQIECDQEVYKPGETVTGTVMWFCSKVPTAIKIELKWQTSGRGTTDKGKANSVSIPCSTAKGDTSFEIKIPADCRSSYSGSLVSLLWSLDCFADISWAIDPKNTQRIVISKTGSPLAPPEEYKGES